MRPEDIKVGTVLRGEENIASAVVVIVKIDGDNVFIKSIYPDEYIKTNCHKRNSDYFINAELYYCPNSEQESNLILPPYYATDTPYEPFKIGDFYNLNIREFSALKYLLRSKDESKRVEDLKKAITCIHKEIIRLESLKE